jgi:hypothetical protein
LSSSSSLQKFERAETFCSAPLPHPLWDHYYAKALNQYYDSLERLSLYKNGGLEKEMRAVTIKALEKFWSITRMPMDEDNTRSGWRPPSTLIFGHCCFSEE